MATWESDWTEGANINRSLLALANCINALADKTKRNGHVPLVGQQADAVIKGLVGRPLQDCGDHKCQPSE